MKKLLWTLSLLCPIFFGINVLAVQDPSLIQRHTGEQKFSDLQTLESLPGIGCNLSSDKVLAIEDNSNQKINSGGSSIQGR